MGEEIHPRVRRSKHLVPRAAAEREQDLVRRASVAGLQELRGSRDPLHVEPDQASEEERVIGQRVEEIGHLEAAAGHERQMCGVVDRIAGLPRTRQSDAQIPVIDLASGHEREPGQCVDPAVHPGGRLIQLRAEEILAVASQIAALAGEPVLSVRAPQAHGIVVQYHGQRALQRRAEGSGVVAVDALPMRHRVVDSGREEPPLSHFDELHAQVGRTDVVSRFRGRCLAQLDGAMAGVTVDLVAHEPQQTGRISARGDDLDAGGRRRLRPGGRRAGQDEQGGRRERADDRANGTPRVHQNTRPIWRTAPGA